MMATLLDGCVPCMTHIEGVNKNHSSLLRRQCKLTVCTLTNAGVAGERAPFSAVKLLVAAARATGSTVYLHELMTGSRIVVDSPAARTSVSDLPFQGSLTVPVRTI